MGHDTITVKLRHREWLACRRASAIAGITPSKWGKSLLMAALQPSDFVEEVDEKEEDSDAGRAKSGDGVQGHHLADRVSEEITQDSESEGDGSLEDQRAKELTYEPEDAAQEGDADVVGSEGLVPQRDAPSVQAKGSGREVVEVLVSQEAVQAIDSSRQLDAPDQQPARGRDDQPPLTYRRQDLCKRCQRLGPCCPECRAKTRNRVPE